MITDANKDITNITYNHLNLPQEIEFTNNRKIVFKYDAAGVKLSKETYDNSTTPTNTHDYIGGIEYENNILQAIYTDEGRAKPFGSIYRYEYTIKDHLGNSRVMFCDVNADGQVDENEIIQEDHYYPFGMRHEGYGRTVAAQGENFYQYNGKELNEDFGLDMYDYGARFYDASVGRWFVIDPLVEKYVGFSPYNYVLGNPIMFIDPNGEDIWVQLADGTRVQLQVNNGNYQLHNENGSSYDGDDEFAANFMKGINYITDNGADPTDVINGLIGDEGTTITVAETKELGGASFDRRNGNVSWDPYGGMSVLDKDGNEIGQQSPAMGLLHELGHGKKYASFFADVGGADKKERSDFSSDAEYKKYKNDYKTAKGAKNKHFKKVYEAWNGKENYMYWYSPEEKRNVQEVENVAAQRLEQETPRKYYTRASAYKTEGPTSIKAKE